MIRGVIFDMDGTITAPYINWKSLRSTIGAVDGQTIMEYIDSLPEQRSRWANDELLKAEGNAARNAPPNDGISELVNSLRNSGLKLAVVTNNHRAAMRTVLERFDLTFDVTLARGDGEIKPSSDLILKALEGLRLKANEVVTVGDGRYDIEASENVGVRCIYITHGSPAVDHTPAVESLSDVLPLMKAEGWIA